MHEPYDDDEDSYDENDSHEYPYDPYKWYYKFDIGPNTPISKWISDMFTNFWQPLDQSMFDKINIEWGGTVPGFPAKKLPVNSWISSIAGENSSLYLGNNYWNEGIWKKKHFIEDKLQRLYVNHLQSHAGYFLHEPRHYKGLYEILN